MIAEHVYTISELNKKARGILEQGIGAIWLKGEVSNLTRAPSGHLYFTLKDAKAEIAAARFKGRSSLFSAQRIENGMEILAYGRVSLYEPRGRYQFIVSLIQPAGLGMLQVAFEQLKAKLQKEGLFDAAHKRPLPDFPERIGVVTSPTGAAIRDIVSVLERRWPTAEVYLFGSSVQGEAAAEEIVAAIMRAEEFSRTQIPLDLLIVGRGGGSLEDLAVFNDERVARAIFACEVPVVSAVGHEIDFVISDFVADLRAPTPSAAAELVVPERAEILTFVNTLLRQGSRRVRTLLDHREKALQASLKGYIFRIPGRRVEMLIQRLDLSLDRLLRLMRDAWGRRRREADRLTGVLHLTDPALPLRRGYSLTFLPGEKIPLRDGTSLSPGDAIETRLYRARILSQVKEVKQVDD
jgi:exodeoxyribonuclease VII large subunit